MASPNRYDLDLKLAELRINGYVLFEDLIPVEKIDRIREAFLPYLEQVRAHGEPESGVMLQGRSDDRLVFEGRLQVVNRYTLYVPWEQPFADPEIYENPVLLDFLDRYWGTQDYRITCYHSNNPTRAASISGGIAMQASPNWCLTSGLRSARISVSSSPWWTLTRRTAASRYCRARSILPTRRWKLSTMRSWRPGISPPGGVSI